MADWPTPVIMTVPVLLAWSTAEREMVSLPPAEGVKLTDVANAEVPERVETQVPVVVAVAVAVELVPEKVTDGAGLDEQAESFSIVVMGLRVAEGLTAVPTAEAGTVTLFRVIWPTVSPPLVLMTVE